MRESEGAGANCHALKQIAKQGNKLNWIQNGQKYAQTLNGLGIDRERITKYY